MITTGWIKSRRWATTDILPQQTLSSVFGMLSNRGEPGYFFVVVTIYDEAIPSFLLQWFSFAGKKTMQKWKIEVREAPFYESPPLFGHCPFGGGGLNPCPDGLGHFFREEFSKFKRAFAWLCGGLNPCPDGLGHLFRDEHEQCTISNGAWMYSHF